MSKGTGAAPLLVRALRREPVERPPIWLLRQAGRYLPEYRRVRQQVGFLELCHDAELAARVTIDAQRTLDVDAAILFSDILVPVEAMGAGVRFDERGPSIDPPVRTESDVASLRLPDPARDLPFVADAVARIRGELAPEIAVIGFAGAPFTCAAYMVEGRPTRDFLAVKRLAAEAPGVLDALLDRLAESVAVCLRAQIEAGADVAMLFDSWAGCLDPWDLERFSLRPAQRAFDRLADLGVPTIFYSNGTGASLDRLLALGTDALSIDWRVPVGRALEAAAAAGKAIQGNLDPLALLGPFERAAEKARAILEQAAGKPGYVFNVGAGLHKETPHENVRRLVRLVREEGRPAPGG